MSRPGSTEERAVHWVGSAKRDQLAMPEEVVDGKQSTRGTRTATRDVALVRERLRAAREDYEARHGTS